MIRAFLTLVLVLAQVAFAQAHFPFVVPEADGTKAMLIFSDTLEPDTRVNIEKISNTKLQVRDASGKDTPLELAKGDARYTLATPGSGPRMIHGLTEYGVLQQGEAKPYRLQYHVKTLLGLVAAPSLGEAIPLEVVPVLGEGTVQFKVLSHGKPLADAVVAVIPPSGARQQLKTDAQGLTPASKLPGRYGVTARWFEAKSGEHAGLKYDEIRHYATLVLDSRSR